MRTAAESRSPVVVTHNDAQPGNWIMKPRAVEGTGAGDSDVAERLRLIDFEYSGPNFRGFEFGNLFCEHAFDYHHSVEPFFAYDVRKYPSLEAQRAFLREYLDVADSSALSVSPSLLSRRRRRPFACATRR